MTQQRTKDSRVSEAELLCKIAKKDEKLSKYKEKYAKLSKKNNYLIGQRTSSVLNLG